MTYPASSPKLLFSSSPSSLSLQLSVPTTLSPKLRPPPNIHLLRRSTQTNEQSRTIRLPTGSTLLSISQRALIIVHAGPESSHSQFPQERTCDYHGSRVSDHRAVTKRCSNVFRPFSGLAVTGSGRSLHIAFLGTSHCLTSVGPCTVGFWGLRIDRLRSVSANSRN